VIVVVLRGIRQRPQRDQIIAAFGVVLAVGGSVLGFLYTRDRIGLPVGFGYAMLVYVALSGLLERRAPRPSIPIAVLVAALGVCWMIRTGERYATLRDTAWEYHLEWDREGVAEAAGQNPRVASLRASALERSPADARRDPAWTYKLFERRHEPAPDR
jgi:drug/metabolite transporter (DMT)-like permease